jgi:hypothetical protein
MEAASDLYFAFPVMVINGWIIGNRRLSFSTEIDNEYTCTFLGPVNYLLLANHYIHTDKSNIYLLYFITFFLTSL